MDYKKPSYRIIFPSYDWDDAWMVNQIINRAKILGRETTGFAKGVPNEDGLTDPIEIRQWIDKNMNGCSCLILFVGEKTHLSQWIKYEIEQASQKKMARFIIHLVGMKKRDGSTCKFGVDPYRYHGLYSADGRGYEIKQYYWIGNDGDINIDKWIEEACLRAGK